MPIHSIMIATEGEVVSFDPHSGDPRSVGGLDGQRPTCLADDEGSGRAWCGTRRGGVFRSDDGGRSWTLAGLEGEEITAVACDPSGVLWVGTEPSALWWSEDGGASWERSEGLLELPSSPEWAFPPRPDTHHVRWIASHPERPGHLWLAIEAGALVSTPDGGRSWRDRVAGGPWDTHELAIHPARPDALRVAAGDGYFESPDGGGTWTTPRRGLEVGYLRSIAIDPGSPDVIVVSGATGPQTTYVAGRSDGRVYRRDARAGGDSPWERIAAGWAEPPNTIAPLLLSGTQPGELWAADERGLHRSEDGGQSWSRLAGYPRGRPDHLRGIAGVG